MTFTLGIHNFKCFRDVDINVHPLTVLCGPNNVGKSSVIQSLVILRSALLSNETEIPLNGVYGIDLGKVADVVTNSPNDDELVISASSKDGNILCRFDASVDREEDRFLTIVGKPEIGPLPVASTDGFGFSYLSAERNGPRGFQSIQSKPQKHMEIGSHGEYTTDVLASLEYNVIRGDMVHPSQNNQSDRNERLLYNVQLWMQDLFPEVSIRGTRDIDAGVATMRYRRTSVESEWMLPSNCGFGISYALPIVLAGLLSPANGMVVIENPEAHLHPAGQSTMGCFLARLAASGTHVMVETHSDHVINGIRLACVDSNPILREDVRIYNFSSSSGQPPEIEGIGVTEMGNLTKWPKSFFDQSEQDLAKILKARKRG